MSEERSKDVEHELGVGSGDIHEVLKVNRPDGLRRIVSMAITHAPAYTQSGGTTMEDLLSKSSMEVPPEMMLNTIILSTVPVHTGPDTEPETRIYVVDEQDLMDLVKNSLYQLTGDPDMTYNIAKSITDHLGVELIRTEDTEK